MRGTSVIRTTSFGRVRCWKVEPFQSGEALAYLSELDLDGPQPIIETPKIVSDLGDIAPQAGEQSDGNGDHRHGRPDDRRQQRLRAATHYTWNVARSPTRGARRIVSVDAAPLARTTCCFGVPDETVDRMR